MKQCRHRQEVWTFHFLLRHLACYRSVPFSDKDWWILRIRNRSGYYFLKGIRYIEISLTWPYFTSFSQCLILLLLLLIAQWSVRIIRHSGNWSSDSRHSTVKYQLFYIHQKSAWVNFLVSALWLPLTNRKNFYEWNRSWSDFLLSILIQ